MAEKYVKDRNHNRYPAYCCEDVDMLLDLVTVGVPTDDPYATKTACEIGETTKTLGRFLTSRFYSIGSGYPEKLSGTWRCVGACGKWTTGEGEYDLYLFRRIE